MWNTSVQSLKYGGARFGQIASELLRRKDVRSVGFKDWSICRKSWLLCKKNKWAFQHDFCSGNGNLNELIFKSSKPGGAWGGC